MKEEMIREEDACLEKTQGSLHCLAATILPPGADKDQWVDQVSMRMKRIQFTNLCGGRMLATEIPGTV